MVGAPLCAEPASRFPVLGKALVAERGPFRSLEVDARNGKDFPGTQEVFRGPAAGVDNHAQRVPGNRGSVVMGEVDAVAVVSFRDGRSRFGKPSAPDVGEQDREEDGRKGGGDNPWAQPPFDGLFPPFGWLFGL